MPNSVLDDIERQIGELNDLGIRPSINLIGGEPTLNLKRFKGYLQWAVDLYEAGVVVGIEMTTNGWWLKELRWLRQFMEAVGETVPHHMYGLSYGFTCRISNDGFHDEYRPRWLRGMRLDIDKLWDGYDDTYGEPVFWILSGYECDSCGEFIEPEDANDDEWWECPECEGGNLYPLHDSEVDFTIPPRPLDIDSGESWLYIDSRTDGWSSIIPTSRNGSGWNDLGDRMQGACAESIVSYKPDGTLNDICCKGSDAPLGTVKDHPLLLMALARKYVKTERPRCSTCKSDAQYYVEHHLEQDREELAKEMERLFANEDVMNEILEYA
jgi:DNA-directed RNA polymerase subunit M/transcription elongation factor TFIIS